MENSPKNITKTELLRIFLEWKADLMSIAYESNSNKKWLLIEPMREKLTVFIDELRKDIENKEGRK